MKRTLVFLSTIIAGAATAHSPYLLPNYFDLGKRDHVSVQASFTENYLVPDVVMKSDDFNAVLPDGSKTSLAPVYTQDLAVLDVATATDGTYRLSSGLRSGSTRKAALLPDGDWKFLRDGDAAPAGGNVHEVRSITRADVYVSRGTPTDKALAPTGQGLEFQMLTHPNKLLAGGGAKLRVLVDGKPAAAVRISVQKAALDAGQVAPLEVTSDAEGHAVLPLATAGIYHLMARHRFVVAGGGAKAQSHTYALTLEVTE